ncbi:MAG: hypothetical protein ACUVXI_08060, partial [bacterium]
ANERAHAEMATKTDLAALREANERAHAEMATKTDLAALKEDLNDLKRDNEEGHKALRSTIRNMTVLTISVIGVLIAGFGVIITLLK